MQCSIHRYSVKGLQGEWQGVIRLLARVNRAAETSADGFLDFDLISAWRGAHVDGTLVDVATCGNSIIDHTCLSLAVNQRLWRDLADLSPPLGPPLRWLFFVG